MIDKGLFDAYARALGANADMAEAAVLALAGECEGMGAAQLAAHLHGAYPALVAEFGAVAAQCAVELYDTLREEAHPASAYAAEIYEPDDAGLLHRDVDDAVAKSSDSQRVFPKLAGLGQQRVMERADETLIRNAGADPAHPKWALVPHPGACGWCVMLGSNGFMYASEASANRSRHGHCKCSPVVDFDTENPSLDGYDPEGMYRRYKQCADTVRDAAEAEWDSMSAAEQAEYKKKGRSAHDVFMGRKVAAEMGARDRDWLNTGKRCQVTKQAGAKPKKKEWDVAEAISGLGFATDFLKPAGEAGKHTADALVNGQRVEFKRPVGDAEAQTIGKNTLDHQFEEASKQSNRILLDLSIIEAYPSVGYREARNKAKELFAGKWRKSFDEMIVYSSSGIERYRNA